MSPDTTIRTDSILIILFHLAREPPSIRAKIAPEPTHSKTLKKPYSYKEEDMISAKKYSTAVFGCAIVFLFLAWNIAIGGDTERSTCDGGGAWMVTVEGGEMWVIQAAPLENNRKSYSMTFQWVNFDATLGGLYPNATITPVGGIAELAGFNLYNYTNLGYGVDSDRTVLYCLRGSGSFSFSDCETIESSGTLGIYSPDQDPFGDDAPTFGCWPVEATAVRVPIVEPCD